MAHYILGGLGNAGRQGMALTGEPTVVNGNPAVAVRVNSEIDGVYAVRVEDACISG